MRMPPKRAPLVRNMELVREAPLRRDPALRDPHHAVHPRGPPLVYAVPVDRGTLERHLVVDPHSYHVADVRLDQRPRRLPVDEDHGLREPVGRGAGLRDVEHILADAVFLRNDEPGVEVELRLVDELVYGDEVEVLGDAVVAAVVERRRTVDGSVLGTPESESEAQG